MTAPRLRQFEGNNQPFDERAPHTMARTMAKWCNDPSKIVAYVNNYYGGKRVTRAECARMIEQRKSIRVRNIPEWTESELAMSPEPLPELELLPEAEPEASHEERAAVFRERPFDVRGLIQNVADAMGLTYGEVIGDGRFAKLVDARSVIVKVLDARGWSHKRQARAINRLDHSTTINLCEKFDIYCRRNPLVGKLFELYRP